MDDTSADDVARAILDGFRRYRDRFAQITLASKQRFEQRQWLDGQAASAERLEMYKTHTLDVVERVRAIARAPSLSPSQWRDAKRAYVKRIRVIADFELAETFFNSINRDMSDSWEVDDTQMFVWSEFDQAPVTPEAPIYTTHTLDRDMVAAVRDILTSFDFACPWQDIDRDIRNILRSLAEARPDIRRTVGLEAQILNTVFYRNKGAYLVGKLIAGDSVWPVVLPILNDKGALYVDTLINDEDELSVVFSFTRSYFMVHAPHPSALVAYLHELLPSKKRSELYASIGMHKHGKTEFYRGFLTHLAHSKDEFILAPGIKGMVMSVFTLPSYQTVFKVIKDAFPAQKNITREEVKEKYYTVKTHDRVGRMADTQEFDHFAFPRTRFSRELIEELLRVATTSVTITDDLVIISHLYTERLMTPLNLYVETATEAEIREALDEYGNAIKQLAGANIFPGDMLLKNFGVTRHGRVVFYDYDEICYLTDVVFRAIPEPRTPEEEMAGESWYSVGPHDVFPEEFRRFLFAKPSIKQIFTTMHGELFDPEYWRALQNDIRSGRVTDVFPYRRKKRFMRRPANAA
ncbi:MAG: bifunctional isocitrate dehydrogenase kinase/phosphatase [Gammaproteobacteria bacterium]|nr:bifunctional isocitrate dehydrogenase kinase/phosphatase [Gammaproteobacteria bacterium]